MCSKAYLLSIYAYGADADATFAVNVYGIHRNRFPLRQFALGANKFS